MVVIPSGQIKSSPVVPVTDTRRSPGLQENLRMVAVAAKRSTVQRCHLLVVQLVDTSPGLQQYLQARLTVGANCCVMEGSQAVAICHVNVSVVLQQ